MPVITNKKLSFPLLDIDFYLFFFLCNLLYEKLPDRVENKYMEKSVCAKIGEHSDAQFAASVETTTLCV